MSLLHLYKFNKIFNNRMGAKVAPVTNATIKILDNAAYTTADKSNCVPAGGEGTLVLADDTSNAVVAVGSSFRLTAIAESTIGTAAANVWLIEGTLMSAQATSFATGALFTAP